MVFLGLADIRITLIPRFELVSTDNLAGGKYTDLPAFFDKSNNIINVKNNDNKCFLWSLLANDYLTMNKSAAQKVKTKRGNNFK